MNKKSDYIRFPFDKFKTESWDIEHIDSFTTNPLKDNEEQKEWVRVALKDLDGNDIPIAERVLEVASVIPVVKIVDKGLDAAKGITKLVKAGEKAGEAAKVYGPTARRVKLRQSVKEQLLERQPRNIEGQIIDPNNGKVIEGNYDIGHKPGHEWRNNKIEYEKNEII